MSNFDTKLALAALKKATFDVARILFGVLCFFMVPVGLAYHPLITIAVTPIACILIYATVLYRRNKSRWG